MELFVSEQHRIRTGYVKQSVCCKETGVPTAPALSLSRDGRSNVLSRDNDCHPSLNSTVLRDGFAPQTVQLKASHHPQAQTFGLGSPSRPSTLAPILCQPCLQVVKLLHVGLGPLLTALTLKIRIPQMIRLGLALWYPTAIEGHLLCNVSVRPHQKNSSREGKGGSSLTSQPFLKCSCT